MKTQYADVIIQNEVGDILLLHRGYTDDFMSGKFCFPGGHIDDGENPTEAAQREAMEETGLTVLCQLIATKEKDDCVIHYFEGQIIRDESQPIDNILLDNEEHRAYEWIPIIDVADKDLVCDLSSYVDELLSQLYNKMIQSKQLASRQLTPEESEPITLDSQWEIIEAAFNGGQIEEEEFFKAKKLYLLAKRKEAIETLEKAFNANIISEEEYFEALTKGGDPSHGGKLIKKQIQQTNGKITTKWVDPHTGEEPIKEKKVKVAPTPQWYDRFKEFKLNCYPIGVDKANVQVNESGDIHSHWILKWKDPKSGDTKNAYSKEFMDRNAAKKWARMKNVSGEQIQSINTDSKAMLRDTMIDEKHKEAAAIINIIVQTGLRRGDKLKFEKTGNRGVSSLSPDNITIEGSTIKFNFVGKSYQDNVATIEDTELASFLSAKIKERKGEKFLFDTTDTIIDKVFQKVGGKGLKIKDMRTYVAGDIARKVLFEDPLPPPPIPKGASESSIKKLVQDKLTVCYKEVSDKLNNTPTMAKNSYIHPNIIAFWLQKLNIDFDITKSQSILGSLGDSVIGFIKSIISSRDIKSYTMDDILAAYPSEDSGSIDEDDEEMCDTFNEPEWTENESTLDEKIEELRAKEQKEYETIDSNDEVKRKEIYDKYDKLITPLLREQRGEMTLEKAQGIVDDYFEKGGKPAFIGEIREFAGRKHIKTTEGWKFYGKGTGDKARTHKKGERVITKAPDPKPIAIEKDSFYSIHAITSKRTEIGGSGGVSLVEDESGKKLVLKEQFGEKNTPDHLKQERLSDDIYRTMGIGVARGNLSYDDGKCYKITEYLSDVKNLSALEGTSAFDGVCKEISKGFVLDCLLLNWDVVGADMDNIVVGKDMKPIRIDNGGSLLYRAKAGTKSESSLTAAVTEIDVMRSSKNPSAQKVFKSITEEDIKSQVTDIVARRNKIIEQISDSNLPDERIAELSKLLNSRIDWLRDKYITSKPTVTVKEKVAEVPKEKHSYGSDTTNEYFKKWDALRIEGNVEMKDGMQKQIKKVEAAQRVRYEEYARRKGVTVEHYKELLQAKVEALVKASDFFRATDIAVLDRVVNIDKRFKSQFETDTSDGSLSPDYRSTTEHTYFGFKDDRKHEKTNRCIYGYFTDNKNGVLNGKGEIPPPCSVSHYGAVTVKMKRDIAMKKATVCFRDSLGCADNNACTPASMPHFTSLSMSSDPLTKMDLSSTSDSYVECQYHNQFTANDIESIHISPFSKSYGEPDYELINRTYDIVRKSHIPVKVFGKK